MAVETFAEQTFTLRVKRHVTITTPPTLPEGEPGVAYSQTLAATGGTPPYTWSLVSGGMPPGLTIDSAGLISGTPTVEGDYSFTVRCTPAGA